MSAPYTNAPEHSDDRHVKDKLTVSRDSLLTCLRFVHVCLLIVYVGLLICKAKFMSAWQPYNPWGLMS